MGASDDILFDRLADGELSPTERRELLASLDGRPDGWRRCALAFLEAQAWEKELPKLVAETTSLSKPASEDVPLEPAWSTNWYALAASVLFAFTLGLALRDLPHSHQTRAPNPSNIAAARPQIQQPQLRAVGSPLATAPAAQADAVTLWVRDQSGTPRQLRVPLVDASALDRRLGLQFQPTVPDNVRQQLEQRGYQVQSKQRYAPLVLDGGQSIVVPVEDTKIVPVSGPVY